MKIINFKLNIAKTIIFVSILIAIVFIILAIKNFCNISSKNTIIMTDENYTNILKDCHENMEKYLGKNIHTIGYIFRANDFPENNFVIARDMLINKNEAQIVGFLANCVNAKDFEENIWVEVHGKIVKGNYHGDIPIISVKTIQRITTPENIFVLPPNGGL